MIYLSCRISLLYRHFGLTLCISLRYQSTQEPLYLVLFQVMSLVRDQHIVSTPTDVLPGSSRLLAETILPSKIGDFCRGSVRRKSILIYAKLLYKRNRASTCILESPAVNLQLILSNSKFDGTDFVEWQRNLHVMASMVHPESSETLDSELRPEPLYQTRRGRGRPATRSVTTSSSTLADALKDEEPTPGEDGGNVGGQHGEIC